MDFLELWPHFEALYWKHDDPPGHGERSLNLRDSVERVSVKWMAANRNNIGI